MTPLVITCFQTALLALFWVGVNIQARKLSSGANSYQVQFRVDGVMTGESFATMESAQAFGRMVDRVGGAAAREFQKAGDKPGVIEMTLSDWTNQFLTKANGMVGGITEALSRMFH